MKKVLILIFFAAQIFASDKISMAVYDFDASGIQQDIASSVADFVQDGLMQTGRFTLIERKDVQRILKEQMFQKTGCTSTECAVEVGKMLNVSNIIKGKVSQMGTRTVISISLVDVEAGKIILTDSVECGSVELLNTGSKLLAEHFSRGVAVRGKVLKITGNDVIVSLGMDDGLKNGDTLTVERYGEAVKDDSGKVVFQEKTKIGIIAVKDASNSGSKAEITEGAGNIKNGDMVELKIEKPRPLEPILSSTPHPSTPRIYDSERSSFTKTPAAAKAPANYDEFNVDFGVTMGFTGTLSFIRYTSTGSISISENKIDAFNNYLNFTIGLSSPVSEFMNIGNMIQLMFPGFTDYGIAGVEDNTRFLMIMNDGLMLKFYPFVGLLNPSFAKSKKPSEQRGDFQPYLGINGNIFLGLLDPDVSTSRSKIDSSAVNLDTVFILGLGLDLRAGFEIGNAVYAEFFWRILSTPAGTTDVKNTSKVKIGTQKYIVDLNTFGIGAGFKF